VGQAPPCFSRDTGRVAPLLFSPGGIYIKTWVIVTIVKENIPDKQTNTQIATLLI